MSLPLALGALCASVLVSQSPVEPEQAPPDPGPHLLTLEGRLEVRGSDTQLAARSAGDLPIESYGLGVARARLELGYRYEKWLRLVLEADFAELPGLRPDWSWTEEGGLQREEDETSFALKDAYARFGHKRLAVRAGHFKPPVSGVELDSSWDLPLVRRGIVHTALTDYMRFTGRRPGVQIEWEPDVTLRPKLVAGAFQGSAADGRLLPAVGIYETNLAARASIRPGAVELGVSGALVGTPPYAGALVGRYWLAAADALFEQQVGPTTARAWADAAFGLSFHGLYGAQGQDARFVTGRALLAWRYGGQSSASPYAELFGMAEGVNFDLTAEDRTLNGYGMGIAVGLWDRLRATAQVELRDVGIHSPALSSGGNRLRDRTAFLVQVGGTFEQRWRP